MILIKSSKALVAKKKGANIILSSIKPKKVYHVVNTGKNGEPLNSSESLTSKQKCWKNILANIMGNYAGCDSVFVKDETVRMPQGFWYNVKELREKAGLKK